MGDQGVVPPGEMTEYLDGLLHPPTSGPAPIRDLSSILLDPTQHFQLDLDQAPKAIAAFREAAAGLRDLMDEAQRLGQVSPPGVDAVSINVTKVINQWASGEEPGSFRWSLDSGAIQLEQAATALERSLAVHRNTDEANTALLDRRQL
jgi:hypothetical protein